MGDMADHWDEVGLDAWIRHEAGDCDDSCQYCAFQAEQDARYFKKLDRMLDNYEQNKAKTIRSR
jgi:biotin synthase-like enzyme